MIECIVAERFNRGASTGRTKPSFFSCQSQNGTTIDVVAKFTAGCHRPDDLAREVLGTFVAQSLNLPTAPSYLVHIPEEIIAVIPDAVRREQIAKSSRIAFGCELKLGVSQWRTGGSIIGAKLALAAAIWAFDAACENSDRGCENVNLLEHGEEWVLIDHEMAWPNVPLIGTPKVWQPNGLAHLSDPSRHIFTQALRESALNLTLAREGWERLSIKDIHVYAESVPEPWNAASAINAALEQLSKVQENLDGFLAEAKRVLT